MIDYTILQGMFNKQIFTLLEQDGFTTECTLTYVETFKNLCPNCLFDVDLNKSANVYKTDGPMLFNEGRICPYCKGAGYYGYNEVDTIYMAILWDYKTWISPPNNIINPVGFIQTLCHRNLLSYIKRAKSLSVAYETDTQFALYGEPEPTGLGDNEFLLSMWKKIA